MLRGVERDLAERTEEAKRLKHEKNTLEKDFRALQVRTGELEVGLSDAAKDVEKLKEENVNLKASFEELKEENVNLKASQTRLRGMTDQHLEKVEQLKDLYKSRKSKASYENIRAQVAELFDFSLD